MKHTMNSTSLWLAATLLVVAAVAWAPVTGAQEEGPVVLNVAVSGNPVPNGRVRATLTIQINDGSNLRSIAWTQTGGVPGNLTGANTRNAILRLGARFRYQDLLFEVLTEPPIGQEQLPPNVPVPETEDGEFPGGLQNRFYVVGVNHFALEEAGLVTLEVAVRTSSGTYRQEVEVHTTLPWKASTGLRNVPIGIPVLVQGKEQARYNWSLARPADSSARLFTTNRRIAEFTPDVAGIYDLTVNDMEAGAPHTMRIYAGNWRGVIVSQDMAGRPIAEDTCTACHSGFLLDDVFGPWAQTGHAEIFTNNLNTSTHYSTACFECHTVGFDPDVENRGIDEASDFQDFLSAGLLNNPGDNWTMVLDEFPATAQRANIQCENCHGPANTDPRTDTLAHGWRTDVEGEPRVSLSSDVCASCHGEPLRHARFQQWQLSGHANYELAIDEGDSGNCSRCHTVNGFLNWLPVLLGEEEGDPLDNIEVTWSIEETHPQTCVACHDPHDIGTTSGSDPNARVRISGATPDLIAGFRVLGTGKAAICMTCHNSRRGLRNDNNFDEILGTSDMARAPHGSSQTDVLMGQNAYFVNVGVRGRHSLIEDSCVTCHMETTPPPDVLSYNQGGTNHTFFASPDICTECHTGITADGLQTVVSEVSAYLKGLIEDAWRDVMADQIAAGNTIDLDGEATIRSAGMIGGIELGEFRGRQALTVTLANGRSFGPFAINSINVVRPAPMGPLGLHLAGSPDLLKAGWNYNLVANDGSRGAHNPTYVLAVLDGARDALGDDGGPRARYTLP